MVVSFLALSLGTITFENPGIRLELFLKEMSKQTGVGFHCPTYLNNEVLAASFKDQSIDVLKSQLARVIHGTWEQKEDGWWLIQSSDQKKEEKKWVRDIRDKILQTQFDDLKAIAPKTAWTIIDAEKYWLSVKESQSKLSEKTWTVKDTNALRLKSSESRFAGTLATLLKPEMFSGDPILGRYTTHGLPGHIELPIDIGEALAQLNSEIQMYRQVSQSPESSEAAKFFEVNLQPGEVPVISIGFFDRNWQYVHSGIPSLYLPTRFVAHGEDYPLSPETQDVFNLLAQFDESDRDQVIGQNSRSPVFQNAVATFANASKRDPLGIKQGRCWLDFARFVKKPLLVNLEEDNGELRPPKIVPTIEQPDFWIGMKREDSDGWVLGRPLNPEYNRGRRCDRSLVESLSRNLSGTSPFSFETQLKTKSIGAFVEHFKNRIPNDQFLYDYMNDGSLIIGILGSLAPGQLDSCLNGKVLSVEAFPPDAHYYLACSASLGMLNELSQRPDKDKVLMCPLYCLPKGVSGMTMSVLMSTEPVFELKEADVLSGKKSLSLNVFAKSIKNSLEKSVTPLASFTVTSKQILTTTFHLGSKSKNFVNSGLTSGKSSPKYTWETLPNAIKNQVLDKMLTLPPEQ